VNAILIGFVAGATLFHQVKVLPELGWLSLILPLSLLWRYSSMRPWIALIIGAGWSLFHVTIHMGHPLPESQERRDLILEGRIDSLPQQQGGLQRFQMQVLSLKDETGSVVNVSRALLSWFGVDKALQVGDLWRLKVRMKRPRGLHNPSGNDYEKWLFEEGIEAKGYVKTWDGNQKLAGPDHPFLVTSLRQTIAQQIDSYLSKPHTAALLKALVVGDRRGLDRSAWQIFTHTGTNHLIAISGLHVGIVAGWLLWIGSWLWRRSERLCLFLPALKAGALLALIGAAGYAALAGFSLPTQRALIMLSTTLGALILGYRVALGQGLLVALFLVVLLDPLAPMRVGFWLSFLAVAVIWWGVAGRVRPWYGWRQLVWLQVYVSLGLFPILFLFFGQASLISPVVNFIMVPWFSMVLIPMVLLGLPMLLIPVLAKGWFTGLEGLVQVTYQILEWFAAYPFAIMTLPQLAPWLLLAAMAGILLLLMPKGMPGRSIGVWLCLPIFFVAPERPKAGEFWITLLDVGQGLACVVETQKHLLLYDTGPAFHSGYSAAESVIVPYLRARGHKRIDRLILSNADQDHAGGAAYLRKIMPMGDILSGEPDELEDVDPCVAGMDWTWEGVRFQILHPFPDTHFQQPNDRSCVLQINAGEQKILLPGDIGSAVEKQLVQHYQTKLASQVVVAPHHGSNTSSSPEFVAALNPDWVLFSAGYKNRYDFPKQQVRQRWHTQGASTLNTAWSGAIQLRISPNQSTFKPMCFCDENVQYWRNCSQPKNAQAWPILCQVL
jgi:competence protein ComEC